MAEIATISPDLIMQELLQQYPGAQRALFRRYHIGGCASCGFQPTETLRQVCARNGDLPLDEVTEHILQSHEAEQQIFLAPAEAQVMAREGARMLDIRTREEFDAVHISGSLLFTQELMQEALMRWDRDAPLVIVDHQGRRSLDAAAYFTGHGFNNVRALRGGIDLWSQEVDPDLPRYHLE